MDHYPDGHNVGVGFSYVTQEEKEIARLQKRITDLEAKLAKSNQELAELRSLHRQMVEGMNGLGERLIDDTCG